jgi:diguanylate cyclase (GGDEF)-like protein/PAS domain S-box-containing protein
MDIHFLQPVSEAEKKRISVLHSYKILDTSKNPSFNNITKLAAQLLNVPVSLISFIDQDRIWSVSHHGTDTQQYERIEGFCASAIHQSKPYIVTDASIDPRSANHPLVKQLPGVRFYAGIPLTVQGKYNLGTLCIIDFKPRELTDQELETLILLSKMAIDAIELHAKNIEISALNNDLVLSEQYFSSVFDQAGVGVSIANADNGNFIKTNQKYCDIVGYSLSELMTIDLNLLTHPDDRELQRKWTQSLCSGEVSEYNIQKRYIRKDQSIAWVDITCTALWKAGEKPTAHIAIVQDITDKKLAEIALKNSEERWSFALEGSNQGVWDLNLESNQIFLSPRCKEMLGYAEDQISNNMDEWVKLIHPDDLPCLVSSRAAALEGAARSFENEHRKFTADGQWKWIQVKGMVVKRSEEGAPLRVIGTYTDISQRKQIEAEVMHLAHYDLITNLPNRTLFLDRLNQDIKKSNRNNKPIAVMMLDLDRFKEVNDTLGHHKGDLLIKLIADRLSSCIRETDTIARLGGDEFLFILTDLNQITDVDKVAKKVLEIVAEPCLIEGDIAYVTGSIGVTLYPADCIDTDTLLKHADQAMYDAKNSGGNRYSYFTPLMQKAAVEKVNLANQLRHALARNEFRLLYQPIVDLNSLQVHKAEALIRWHMPDQVFVSPALFIPIAEETGQIVEIGEWVFKEAANAIKSCRQRIYPDFQISINKSPVQFRVNNEHHSSWFEYLKSLKLPGSSLVVEITEGLLLDKSESLSRQFEAFKDAGIQVALDDFGTGYSSLSYLKQYHIDYIKIDQIFVKNLAPNSEDLILCEAIIVMAHKLKMQVIAEGVETLQQLEILKAAGCDFAQGYYFSKPIPLEDLLKFRVVNELKIA